MAARYKTASADKAKRQPRGEARRQAILDSAIEVLAKKGRRGLRVTELAEAVGVKHTNLTYYFGSKERLLREAVEERQRREEWFYGISDEKLRLSQLPNAARLIEKNILFTRLYVVLGAESLEAEDDLHDFFVGRYQRARTRIATAVRNEQDLGILRTDVDPEQVAFEVISFMMGLEIQWLTDPAHVDYVRIMETYTDGLYERFEDHGRSQLPQAVPGSQYDL